MFNANNYGYNPYGRYIPQQPMQQQYPNVNENLAVQPVNNSYKLNGKQVESIEVVKAMDIPLDGSTSYFPLIDGSTSYFPLIDGSKIITKQIQTDGTSKVTIYEPVERKNEEIRSITIEDVKKEVEKIDLSEIDDLKDELKELKKEIKDLKKKKASD